jgi:pimeloyl-ACP methyl ester carboxylesterase
VTRVVYLHGFASSPRSRKAQYFRKRCAERGVEFQAPEMDQGSFRNLTITGQLAVIDCAVARQPAILMGSSLGGYVAALYAQKHAEIERLILLAPAFQFLQRWRQRLSAEELASWKQTGVLSVFHYGAGANRDLGYQFLTDAGQYPDQPDFAQPALILHGTKDEIVPVEISQTYAATHPNVRITVFDSGHELTGVLEPMWREVEKFCQFQKS